MKLKRLIIYPKDIMLITGKSERYSRYLHKRIKKQLGKEDHQVISVNEFCNYMGLEPIEVEDLLLWKSSSICIHLMNFFSLISERVLSNLTNKHQISSEQAGEQTVFLDL